MESRYIIYDGRYRFDPDMAIVMDTADTFKEAVAAAKEQGDSVIFDTEEQEVAFDTEND